MDVWSENLHLASYGGVELDVLTARDSVRRMLARHSYLRRDGGNVDDEGGDPRVTRCRIIFFERPPIAGEQLGTLDHLQRFETFWNAANAGVSQEFVHPITGSYNAKVEGTGFSVDAEERDTIVVDCTFVEDNPDVRAEFEHALRPVPAGVATVEVTVAELNAQLDELDLESDVGERALSTVQRWGTDPDLTARQVSLELNTLSSRIAAATDTLQLATDLTRHPVWRSLQRLHGEVRRAARVFQQRTPTLIEHTLKAATPLRVFCAQVYGADQAQERYEELQRLNDIDDPSLVPAGTTLLRPDATSSPRQGLRSATR